MPAAHLESIVSADDRIRQREQERTKMDGGSPKLLLLLEPLRLVQLPWQETPMGGWWSLLEAWTYSE